MTISKVLAALGDPLVSFDPAAASAAALAPASALRWHARCLTRRCLTSALSRAVHGTCWCIAIAQFGGCGECLGAVQQRLLFLGVAAQALRSQRIQPASQCARLHMANSLTILGHGSKEALALLLSHVSQIIMMTCIMQLQMHNCPRYCTPILAACAMSFPR